MLRRVREALNNSPGTAGSGKLMLRTKTQLLQYRLVARVQAASTILCYH